MPEDMPTAEETPEAEVLHERVEELQRKYEHGSAEGKPDPATAENSPGVMYGSVRAGGVKLPPATRRAGARHPVDPQEAGERCQQDYQAVAQLDRVG